MAPRAPDWVHTPAYVWAVFALLGAAFAIPLRSAGSRVPRWLRGVGAIDERALAFVRIGLGILLMFDAADMAWWAKEYFGDRGVLSRWS